MDCGTPLITITVIANDENKKHFESNLYSKFKINSANLYTINQRNKYNINFTLVLFSLKYANIKTSYLWELIAIARLRFLMLLERRRDLVQWSCDLCLTSSIRPTRGRSVCNQTMQGLCPIDFSYWPNNKRRATLGVKDAAFRKGRRPDITG